MTLVVPFDGSELSESALRRAVEFGDVFDEEVIAVTVVPDSNTSYARERGWLDGDEPFDRQTVVSRLSGHVESIAPDATHRHVLVDRYAPAGTISNRLRRVAWDVDATMVFVGSDNAGQIIQSISSVGTNVATDSAYDVVIVRNPTPLDERK